MNSFFHFLSSSLVCFCAVAFCVTGCGTDVTDPSGNGSDDVDVDDGPDDTDNVGDADAHGDEDVENSDSGTDNEEFTKPDEFLQGQLLNSNWCKYSESDHSVALGGRPHMKSTILAKEAWLYPGEFFVLDGCLVSQDIIWWLPADYYIFALHEGNRLPIRVVEQVDEFFSGMDEIESWDEEDYADIFYIRREPFVAFNYTFVIPPWAFPEEGAYNVQFVKLPAWQPHASRPLIEKMGARGNNQESHRTHTIYYGSEMFVETDPIRNRQHEAVKWDVYEAGNFVNNLHWMFVAPPRNIYDWSEFPTPYDAEIGQVFEVNEPTVTLDFFYAGGELAWSILSGEVLYYVFRNDKVIDMFLLEPPEFDLFTTDWSSNQGYVLPIEVEVAEEITAVTVMAVPRPFEPQLDDPTPMGNRPVASNTLLLRYAPQ